jgi:hypothetical protein
VSDTEALHLNDFTIGMWVKPNSLDDNAYLIAKRNLFSTMDWGVYYSGVNDEITFQIGESNADVVFGADNYVPDLNEWHYLVIRKNGNRYAMYEDGVMVASDTSSATWTDSDDLKIGSGDGMTFDGLIDDVRIYNYARSQAQIMWDYNQGKPVGHWKFDDASSGSADGASILDSSGNGNNGTGDDGANNSGLTWTTGKFGNALEFDGTDDFADIGDTSLNAKTISFWIKPDSDSEDIIDFDGGARTISLAGGVIQANGFTDSSIYVDAEIGSNVDTNWHHITIATSTAVDVNDFDIGRIGSSYFGGLIDDVRIYNYIRTPDQIRQDYNGGARLKYGD